MSEKKNTNVVEGRVVKGGQNPPNNSDARPVAPRGSGGKWKVSGRITCSVDGDEGFFLVWNDESKQYEATDQDGQVFKFVPSGQGGEGRLVAVDSQ